jgi:DnaK suppressor protein
MDPDRARALLETERARVERLLAQSEEEADSDFAASKEIGDIADPAERLTAAETDNELASELRTRLEAIGRAEQRLRDGAYGRSVKSGAAIPDDRLEADPAAELTVEEAAQQGL